MKIITIENFPIYSTLELQQIFDSFENFWFSDSKINIRIFKITYNALFATSTVDLYLYIEGTVVLLCYNVAMPDLQIK